MGNSAASSATSRTPGYVWPHWHHGTIAPRAPQKNSKNVGKEKITFSYGGVLTSEGPVFSRMQNMVQIRARNAYFATKLHFVFCNIFWGALGVESPHGGVIRMLRGVTPFRRGNDHGVNCERIMTSDSQARGNYAIRPLELNNEAWTNAHGRNVAPRTMPPPERPPGSSSDSAVPVPAEKCQ